MKITSIDARPRAKKKKLLAYFVLFVLFLVFIFVKPVDSAINLSLSSVPETKSRNLPVVTGLALADAGRTIDSAEFQIYPASQTPSGAFSDCTASNSYVFGEDQEVGFACTVASLSEGEYKMNIKVTDSLNQSTSVETSTFIVDRVAPVVTFAPLIGGPLLINYSNPVFSGTVSDSLTNVVTIEYKYLEDVPTGQAIPESGLTEHGWNSCQINGSGLEVDFVCDPNHIFPNNNKNQEHRMYVRAVDEVGNISSYSNYYTFLVDIVPPTDLAIISPTNPGLVFYGNHNYDIEWVAPKDNFELGSKPIKIEYSASGSFNDDETVIISAHSPTGPYNWLVPSALNTNQAKIRITATDLAGNSISSVSANPFIVIPYSAPQVTIYSLPNNISAVLPIIITANATDPQGIASARYRIDSGAWSDCVANDGSFDSTNESIACGAFSVSEGTHSITIQATDTIGDVGSRTYSFIYDKTPPVVNAGSLGTINQATAPGATATDAHSSVATRSWAKISGPGSVTFSNANVTNPNISANQNGDYVVALTACDLAGNCASDTVSFTWTDAPLAFSLTNPSGGERLKGTNSFISTWTNPGGTASYSYKLDYSTNGGQSWSNITTGLSKAQLSYNWTLPSVNSENMRLRVQVLDSSSNVILSETSNSFVIDSTAPVVNSGSLGSIDQATSPGASASDNFDNQNQLSYSWTHLSGPASTKFSNTNILNPQISGTITGDYTARLTVTDRVGNSSFADLEFHWQGDPAPFSVLEPNLSYYLGGATVTILWSPAPGASHYQLQYSLDQGLSYQTIVSSTTGTVQGGNLSYSWTLPEIDASSVYVRIQAFDSYGNSTSSQSGSFLIDSSAPLVDLGELGIIYLPTKVLASASDGSGSGIASYSWTQIAGPESGQVSFTGGDDILEPTISADKTGIYWLRLTVTDNVGLSTSKDTSIYYSVDPFAPVITSPGSEESWPGESIKKIRWEVIDPGNLSSFSVYYSLDLGVSWQLIDTLADSERSLDWSVPLANQATALIKIVVANDEGKEAHSIRQFAIDSQAPDINASDLGYISVVTSPEIVVTDNIDSEEQLSYTWETILVPEGGSLLYSPNKHQLKPGFRGTVTGDYATQLIVVDRAGNMSTAIVNFYWQGDPTEPVVTFPDSTVFSQGGLDLEIEWYLEEDEDLDHFELFYSADDGITWQELANSVPAQDRSYNWSIPPGTNSLTSASSLILVNAVDIYGNNSSGLSANFSIDSIAPLISLGHIESPISEPTQIIGTSASDNLDSLEDLDFLWTPLSLPLDQAQLTITTDTDLEPYFSGDVSGEYEVLLTVTDQAGNYSTSTVSFIWQSLYDPLLTKPQAGDTLAGASLTELNWTLVDPGNLLRIETEYSLDAGASWQTIATNIDPLLRSYEWQVPPATNSTTSLVRLMTVADDGLRATSTSGLFTIDSEPPLVDAGSFSEALKSAQAPGASASDNFTATEDLSYHWSTVSAPSGGSISFAGGASQLNPKVFANRNGNYVAQLTVTDLAGNFASDTVSFTRQLSSGGGGGGSLAPCQQVSYGDWGACVAGSQYRSIIDSVPPSCQPTEAQRQAQERPCSDAVEFCQLVRYDSWGECINGSQYRSVIWREPYPCTLTSEQESEQVRACQGKESGPFDDDASEIMEQARKDFVGTDQSLLKRVLGQILIQVEDKGRAWYVSAIDQQRYYLGSPLNAFSVMSLIGLGISNDRLAKIPVGILFDSLTLDKDSDGDGLPDRLEEGLLTNPFNPDTDGDGHDDLTEVLNDYDPNGPGKMPYDKLVQALSLGHIYIQVETNGEAWYVEPKSQRRYYLGRPEEAFAIMRNFGLGISNEDLNRIPVGRFTDTQVKRIERMLDERLQELAGQGK